MSKYQEKHYEDVARIICTSTKCLCDHFEKENTFHTERFDRCDITAAFADLFAADNLPSSRCWTCGNTKEAAPTCTRPDGDHRFGGFDRERFLAACGLEETS